MAKCACTNKKCQKNCEYFKVVFYLRNNTKYHLKLERNAYLIHLSWCYVLFCIANGMLNQIQSEKRKSLVGKPFPHWLSMLYTQLVSVFKPVWINFSSRKRRISCTFVGVCICSVSLVVESSRYNISAVHICTYAYKFAQHICTYFKFIL